MAHIGFTALSAQLAAKGAKDPDALAAHIKKKKYGRADFVKLVHAAHAMPAGRATGRSGAEEREVPFELETSGDGRTLVGYAAVFDQPATIRDEFGQFEETISQGAFTRSLQTRPPVVMFEHGRHPLIGTMPLGKLRTARQDTTGLYIEVPLTDNWLIQPVRDAVRDGAVSGMSFRFTVPQGGDQWEQRSGQLDLRTIRDANVSELGPVVFPAYTPTTASIRSLVEHLPDLTARPGSGRAGGGDPRDAGQRDAHPSAQAQARHRELLMMRRTNRA
jgi:HK97 family phage prohead protease